MRPNRCRRDMHRAWDRVLAIPSEELKTPRGTVEYAERGQGPPVLVSHGIMGGHDVGLGLSDSYIGPAVHVIAPSRFGYFRSALPESASPAVQADVYALLLDHLGVAIPVTVP